MGSTLNHKIQIVYECQLCANSKQEFGPYETATTTTLKNHMVQIHNIDKLLTNWDKYYKACKKERIETIKVEAGTGSEFFSKNDPIGQTNSKN